MPTIKARLDRLETLTSVESLQGLRFVMDGVIPDAYQLTLGNKKWLVERLPEESHEEFEQRIDAELQTAYPVDPNDLRVPTATAEYPE